MEQNGQSYLIRVGQLLLSWRTELLCPGQREGERWNGMLVDSLPQTGPEVGVVPN
jgi:hypothetical protein